MLAKTNDKTQTLWTRNFQLAISGMIISALAGVGFSVALGVLVYSETQSTWLNAIYFVSIFLPDVILPVFFGAYVDRHNPLKTLVSNELVLAAIFFLASFLYHRFGFEYYSFLTFSILISSLGVLSKLAGYSLLPQIMDVKYYSKGNAIISTIYPLSNFIMAPIMILLLKYVGFASILFFYGLACVVDVLIESRIDYPFEYETNSSGSALTDLVGDLKAATQYINQDRGLKTILFYFSVVMLANGTNSLIYPYFNQSTTLTNDHYGLLLTFESAGYFLGGLTHYFLIIPDKWRYLVAVVVYFCFSFFEGAFFFAPFFLMLIIRFVLGFGGMNSANIRISAVQRRVSNQFRAKVESLFMIAFTLAQIIGRLAAGYLAELLPINILHLSFNILYCAATIIFILPVKNGVKTLYNYTSGD